MLSFRGSPSAGLWCIMYKAAGVCFTLCLTLLSRFRHIAAFISAVEVNQRGFIPKRLRRASTDVTLNLFFLPSFLLPCAYFKDRVRNRMLVYPVNLNCGLSSKAEVNKAVSWEVCEQPCGASSRRFTTINTASSNFYIHSPGGKCSIIAFLISQ